MSAVPPVNIELSATPTKTIVAGVVPRRREMARIITVVAIPPANAQSVTSAGFVTVSAEDVPPALTCIPAPKYTIATAAPKDAPWDTPSVDDEASGFRSTFCMMQPLNASAAPTAAAVASFGIRTFQIIVSVRRSPRWAIARITSFTDSPAEPAISEKSPDAAVMTSSTSSTSHFLHI